MKVDLRNQVEKIGKILNDGTNPLKQRFRALFTLRNIGGKESIAWIEKMFIDPSVLLKHELAYCLGQMGDEEALPILMRILRDESQDPIVRHEAGEAIGAIGSEEGLEVLKQFVNDPIQEVSETCHLAIQRIRWVNENKQNTDSPYQSIDPTPRANCDNITNLENILLNENADLFDRYRAMFSLRNINSEKSVNTLCKGLFSGSALFRHEVAFVLGQLQKDCSTPFLIQVLEDQSQHEMVRHESAEALGAIASKESTEILKKFLNDESRVVRESCEIALDMADYEMSSDFQYANSVNLLS